jgi:hypothetical protein
LILVKFCWQATAGMLASQLAPAGRLLRRRGFTGPGNDEADSEDPCQCAPRDHAHWLFFWKAYLPIKQPLTAHDPTHLKVSSRHDTRTGSPGRMGGGLVPRQMIHAPQCFAESAGRVPQSPRPRGPSQLGVDRDVVSCRRAVTYGIACGPAAHTAPESGLPSQKYSTYR